MPTLKAADEFIQEENTVEVSESSKDIKCHESRTSSESGSSSHHKSSSHNHSISHRSSKKKSFFKRIKRKFNKKSRSLQILVAVLIVLALLGGVFWVEKEVWNKSVPHENEMTSTQPGIEATEDHFSQSITIPTYWENEVSEKTKVVEALQTAGGKDCVSFVWASDTHIPDNLDGRTNDLGGVMAQMLDNCEIPFAVLSGDIGTRYSYSTEEEFMKTQEQISEHLAPLWGTDRLLVALGNHDGCYGDPNGEPSGSYRKQYTPERMWQLYFREQALDFRRVFSEDGSYFYVDNIPQKTRFIVLNSQFGGKYATDGNGWALNDRFATSCYGQDQLDWLANIALDMPSGFSAIITTHVPPKAVNGATTPYTVDYNQLIGIINAYCNKTTFSGSYTGGVEGWSNSTVTVDFTEVQGEIIAVFAGHVHWDTIDTTTLACPLITIISAGASVNEPSLGVGEEAPTRTFGTDTETSFDVVTINKKTRTIYCTRVGAGEDRIIQY